MRDKKKKQGKQAKVRKRAENRVSRRAFLTTAVATGAAAVVAGFPYIKTASAQSPVVLRVQSTWPARDIFHLSLLDVAKKITDMGGGRLRFEVLPAGAVAPPFGVIDAVHRGVLDGGHGVPAYWFGRNVAASLFGTGPSFGMDAIDLLSWYYYGGGFQMYQDLLQGELRMNVVSFLYGPMPTQPLGWFREPVANVEQLRGVRYRTVGLAAELFRELGASVVILPAGEIVPALERGVIDAAEFNNMTSDRLLGFPDVRKTLMLQSYHQPVEALELLLNKARWDALPADLQAIVRNAVFAEGANFHYKMIDQNSKDMEEMVARQGVRLHSTPRDVLLAQLRAWDRIIGRHSRANPIFARIIASQRAWARRVVRWKLRTYVENRTAFEHHFGRL